MLKDGILQQVGTPRDLYEQPEQRLRRRLHRQPGDEPASRRTSVEGGVKFGDYVDPADPRRRRRRPAASRSPSACGPRTSRSPWTRGQGLPVDGGPRRGARRGRLPVRPRGRRRPAHRHRRARRRPGAPTRATVNDPSRPRSCSPGGSASGTARRSTRSHGKRLSARASCRLASCIHERLALTSPRRPSIRRLLDLPWDLPLEDWPTDTIAALPKGISRHIVRFANLSGYVIAVKETTNELATQGVRHAADARSVSRCRASSPSP